MRADELRKKIKKEAKEDLFKNYWKSIVLFSIPISLMLILLALTVTKDGSYIYHTEVTTHNFSAIYIIILIVSLFAQGISWLYMDRIRGVKRFSELKIVDSYLNIFKDNFWKTFLNMLVYFLIISIISSIFGFLIFAGFFLAVAFLITTGTTAPILLAIVYMILLSVIHISIIMLFSLFTYSLKEEKRIGKNLKTSFKIMRKNIKNTYVFGLSLFGWAFLMGVPLIGWIISFFYALPYITMTTIRYYTHLLDEGTKNIPEVPKEVDIVIEEEEIISDDDSLNTSEEEPQMNESE